MKTALFLAVSALALPLGACKFDDRPLLARGNPPPPPTQTGLPQPGLPGQGYVPGSQTYYQPGQGGQYQQARYAYEPAADVYPYAERAYALDRAFYDTPPDWGFSYDGVEPWVWETAYDDYEVAYPYDDGYVFYYYEPGYDYPYFIRDADYGYAFGPGGVLDAMFDTAGVLVAADVLAQYAEPAHRWWSSGYDLRRAWDSAPRLPVNQTVWSKAQPVIGRDRTAWIRAGDAQPAWRAWRAQSGDAIVRRYDPVRQTRLAALSTAQATGFQPGWSRAPHGAAARAFANNGAPFMARGGGRMGQMAQAPNEAMAGRSGHAIPGRGPEMRPAFAGGPDRRFAPPPGFARSAEGQGRNAVAREPRFAEQGQMRQAPQTAFRREAQPSQRFARAEPPRSFAQPQPRHEFAQPQARFNPGGGAGWRGGGRGGWHGAEQHAQPAPQAPHFAQAAPQPHVNPGGGGGGWRGGGGGQPHAAPQGGQGGGGQPHPQGNGGGQNQKDKHGH